MPRPEAPVKVLLCHNFYREPGGELRAVELQRELLERRGHRVASLTRNSREIDDWGPLDKLRFPATVLWSRRTEREVRDAVERERPDVAHVHNVFPLLSPSLYRALARSGIPIVQTIHNYRLLCPNALFYTRGEICRRCKHGNTFHAVRLRCYRDSRVLSGIYAASLALHRRRGTFGRVDRFLAPNDFVARELAEGGIAPSERITVVPHFLPTPLHPPEPPDEVEPYALYLGRLSPEKGVDLLLEAFEGLPDHRLVVAGDGPDREALEDFATRRKLDHVHFAGFVTGERKRRLLARAWVTVIPSRVLEVFPLALLESLEAGVPVVVSGHGGLAAVVDEPRGGLWFRPGDSKDLRDRLAGIFENADLRRTLSSRARRQVETHYTEDVAAHRLIGVYRELIE